jgi:hypothetical protein
MCYSLCVRIRTEGHDSVQDAAVALELAFLKAAQVIAGTAEILPWGEEPVPKCSVFETLLVAAAEVSSARLLVCIGENLK